MINKTLIENHYMSKKQKLTIAICSQGASNDINRNILKQKHHEKTEHSETKTTMKRPKKLN